MTPVKRLLSCFLILVTFNACGDNANPSRENDGSTSDNKISGSTSGTQISDYKEGVDYMLFDRVRIVDNTGFDVPAEAYSVLLPKGWKEESIVFWNRPGSSCAGTYKSITASSPDNKYRLEMYPDVVYTWDSDPQMNQFNRNNQGNATNCTVGEPLNAEEYLKNVFAPGELQNAEVIKVESNPLVVEEMQSLNDKARQEIESYGATNVQFDQTAINATVRFADKSEGLVILGVSVLENTVPNVYNGTSTKLYTTQVAKRIVYRYPAAEKDQAVNQFALIMGSFRTNQAWADAVNRFWKDVREKKQIAHIGKLRMIDEQTRAIGERAIAKGNNRLNEMDNEMRNWEAKQSSQDRMHTNFIKTIREVENYQDPTGKIELTSGYNHAWSRGDGNSFILSNSPNFDPSSVFQDQNWKEMKKVD